MPATPKELRAQPPRVFENYVLTRSTAASVNLTNIHDSKFLPCSPGIFGDPGVGYSDDSFGSYPIDIGFDFQIDGRTYKQFTANENGWMVLLDKNVDIVSTGSTWISDFLFPGSGSGSPRPWTNSCIKPTFSNNHVLLAPWFDDLRNVASTPEQLTTAGSWAVSKAGRVRQGLEAPPITLNAVQNSVKFFRDERSSGGRRLIVRWNSLSNYVAASTILRFETVIYESGKIEFRYAPRGNLSISAANANESATIGVFMPGGANRFRDFSYGLGYRDGARQQYRYGGAVYDPTYTDVGTGPNFDNLTASYTCNLKPLMHWPGLGSAGNIFTFAPPMTKRRVLPRLELRKRDNRLVLPTVARTGDTRLGSDPISFDDRRTLLGTSNVVINAPSMMQRFYGDSEPTSVNRQNLFAGDFEFTASIVQSVVDQFLQEDVPRSIEPFSEYKLFENDPTSTADAFYVSGSSLDSLGDGLTQPLKAKTQIRMSFPVNNNVVLFGTASTIHYYNVRAGAWEVPQNSSYTISVAATTNDSGRPKGDIVHDRSSDAGTLRIIEDHKGFGPIGNTIASGSHNRLTVGDQTDSSIGSPYTTDNVTLALNKSYAKSVTVNEDYRATADEVFRLPINHPFLIERAVLEIPFAAGNGWFADRTMCLSTLENNPAGGFDFGGPGLTVALFNQTVIGDTTRRDLIMSGVITHENDNVDRIIFSTFPPITSTYQIRPRGYLAYGGTPSAVVTPRSSSTVGNFFTGSVAVRCEAQVSNGVIVKLELAMTSSDIQANKSGVIDVFNSAQLTLVNRVTSHYSQSCYIAYIKNVGRGGTGFEPSGRSIFGKEFITSQLLNEKGRIDNPFYLTGTKGGATSPSFTGIPDQYVNGITGGNTFKFEMALPLQNFQPSPYLVTPNDTLILAISKSRPVFYGTQTPGSKTSGSVEHDVQLITGSINVVLYGSLLRENKEFHDTLNQPLASDAIHEIVIGNEPVIDQFEVAYKDQYVGGFSDDFVTGSLVTKSSRAGRKLTLATGSRGRVFSEFSARLQPSPDSSTAELAANPSKNFRLQPWWERCGSPRVSNYFDDSERYWDTLMPDVSVAFAQDSMQLFTIASSDETIIGGGIGGSSRIKVNKTAFVMFDFFDSPPRSQDNSWSRSFPYEPRYAPATRQVNIQASFIATARLDSSASLPVGQYLETTSPIRCDLLMVGFSTYQAYSSFFGFTIAQKRGWYVDTDLRTNVTGAMNINDTAKVLFGFGDLNTCYNLSDTDPYGSNHYAEGRVIEKPDGIVNSECHFHFAPVIRGWKYGVRSGIAEYSHATFRQGRFGQFRDMLEQKQYTKFYLLGRDGAAAAAGPAAIAVKFVDATGKLTKPENTWSQNLSFEATSSMPYFDGETRNRQAINTDTLNANIVTFKSNQFGQVTL